MLKSIKFSVVFLFSFYSLMQGADRSNPQCSWYGLIAFAGMWSLHNQLSNLADRNPEKSVTHKIQDFGIVTFSSYLMASPGAFPQESNKANILRCFVGFGLMWGHLGYRWYNRNQARQFTHTTIGAHNLMVGSNALFSVLNSTSGQTPEEMQKRSDETP